MMVVRADLGMVFQEGALFDSLTVRENVGYKLFEELNWPLDEADRGSRKCSASSGSPSSSTGCRRSSRAGSAGASRSRARWRPSRGSCCTTSRRPGSTRSPSLTVDEEIIKLRDLEGVSSIVVTHQLRDAFYVAEHTAPCGAAEIDVREGAPKRSPTRRSSSCCEDGRIRSKATPASSGPRRDDPYIDAFLS